MIEGLKPYAEYKESEVPWVGSVPSDWRVERTKWIFRTKKELNVGRRNTNVLSLTLRGVVNNDPDSPEGMVPKDYATYQLFRKHDLVFKLIDLENIRTSRVGLVHEDGIMSSAYVRLAPSKSVNIRFFYFQFFDLYTRAVFNALGAGVRSTLGAADLGELRIAIPPPDEQAAIVRFLDHANRKIDGFIRAKRKLIGLLNEQKKAIIHHAVTGKDEVRMMKDENGNSSFILQPSSFPKKPSGIPWLGDIPMHWDTMRLKNACKIRGGFAFKTEWFRADGIPVIRMSNLRRGALELTDAVRISENDCVAGFELKAGDILYGLSGSVGATGSLGNFAVVATGDLPAQLNQRVARFRPDGRVLSVRFLVFLIQTSIFYDQVLADTTGTAQFNVSTNDVGKVTFSLPSVTEQAAICDWLDGALAKPNEIIARTEREIALMQEYRTRLTADLVTGKLDVRAAAARLPEEKSDVADTSDESEMSDLSEEPEEPILEEEP